MTCINLIDSLLNRNDDNSQDSVVDYDELSQQGDEKENAMIKKMQKQQEEEFSGDEEEYEEVVLQSMIWKVDDSKTKSN